MTYNEKQKKLAADVLGNFEATVPAGYWVRSTESDDRDADSNPYTLTIEEDNEDGTTTTHEVTWQDVCGAFVKVAERQYTDLRRDLFKTIRDMWEGEDYLGEDGPGGDAETDDVLVQIACFGEVVFG